MEVLMHGHHNTLLSVMTLDQRLIEIKQKSIGEQPMRKHLIQFIPLESLPPEFSACVEAIKMQDEIFKVWGKVRDEAAKTWSNACNEAWVKARDKPWNKAWASDKAWNVAIKAWDKAQDKTWDEVVKARNEARNNFTRLCALHKGALEVLHRERCLSIHPDCPWNGERLVVIG